MRKAIAYLPDGRTDTYRVGKKDVSDVRKNEDGNLEVEKTSGKVYEYGNIAFRIIQKDA